MKSPRRTSAFEILMEEGLTYYDISSGETCFRVCQSSRGNLCVEGSLHDSLLFSKVIGTGNGCLVRLEEVGKS